MPHPSLVSMRWKHCWCEQSSGPLGGKLVQNCHYVLFDEPPTWSKELTRETIWPGGFSAGDATLAAQISVLENDMSRLAEFTIGMSTWSQLIVHRGGGLSHKIWLRCSWAALALSECATNSRSETRRLWMKLFLFLDHIFACKNLVLTSLAFNHVILEAWRFLARSITAIPSTFSLSCPRRSN